MRVNKKKSSKTKRVNNMEVLGRKEDELLSHLDEDSLDDDMSVLNTFSHANSSRRMRLSSRGSSHIV